MQQDPYVFLEGLFERRGGLRYGVEAVSQVEHALQCATLAREARASAEFVVACLLHDVGHLLDREALPAGLDVDLDDRHEQRGHRWLGEHFGPAVTEPVRLHVAAKRYIAAIEPTYVARLSPTSRVSLEHQGGPFTPEECERFVRLVHAAAAVRLRRFDDAAKVPGAPTEAFEAFETDIVRALAARG